MLKLYCKKCNYQFEKEKVPFRCPYCATEGSVEKKRTAQDILDEIS